MAQIFQRWLSTRLEEDIKWGTNDFGEATKDGVAIATILQCHNLISDSDKCLIIKTKDYKARRYNWNKITTWLENIDIDLSETEIEGILAGEELYILRLFYKIFLCLEKLVRTDFIRKAQLRTSLRGQNKLITEPKAISKIEYTVKPCCNVGTFTKWQNMKTEELNKSCDQIRNDLLKKMPIREREKPSKIDFENASRNLLTYDTIELKYNEVSEINNNVLQLGWLNYDPVWTKEFVEQLQIKMKIREDERNLVGFAKKLIKNKNLVSNDVEESSIFTQKRLNKNIDKNIQTLDKKDAKNLFNYDKNDEIQVKNTENDNKETGEKRIQTTGQKDAKYNFNCDENSELSEKDSEIELRNVRLESIMEITIDKEEHVRNYKTTRKLLKLSQFEKQIWRIFLEKKNHARSLLKTGFRV